MYIGGKCVKLMVFLMHVQSQELNMYIEHWQLIVEWQMVCIHV